MRRFGWQWLAVSSLLLWALAANSETRQQYGGTLHVMMQAAPSSLDPAERPRPESVAQRSITSLIFDTLVTADDGGQLRAALAESWQATRGNRGVQVRLRHGVKFHDGTPLTLEAAAASLRTANPTWKVRIEDESLEIENESSIELLQELALPRNAVAKRDGDRISGTGPFHIVDWQSGRKLSLGAEEGCWRGRPFVDAIEIEMGRSFRDQMTALELGKADLVQVAPEQMHRVSPERFHLLQSRPIELLALRFAHDVTSPEEGLLREALRFSVERESIHSVLLQGAGQATGSILPTWISGYGFVFSSEADLTRARQLRDQVHIVPNWTLGYDSDDPLARLLAERVALNAKDARISMHPSASATADLQLLQIPLASTDPWVALEDVSNQVNLPLVAGKVHSVEALYAAEQAMLSTGRIIPLFHLPVYYAAAPSFRDWSVRTDGSLDLADGWLKSPQP